MAVWVVHSWVWSMHRETGPLNTIKHLLDENYCTSKPERLDDLSQWAVVIYCLFVLHCCHKIFGSLWFTDWPHQPQWCMLCFNGPVYKWALRLICPPIIGIYFRDWMRFWSKDQQLEWESVRVSGRLISYVWPYSTFSRVVTVWAPSLCGLLGTEGGRRTAATVTATQTASTPCPSAAPPRTATSPGTARRAPPPLPLPTARGT